MTEDLLAVIGQKLLDAKYRSGILKGWPILCSDPDFNDLPFTPDSMTEDDDYSEEDIRALAESVLVWVLERLEDPGFDPDKLAVNIRQCLK